MLHVVGRSKERVFRIKKIQSREEKIIRRKSWIYFRKPPLSRISPLAATRPNSRVLELIFFRSSLQEEPECFDYKMLVEHVL